MNNFKIVLHYIFVVSTLLVMLICIPLAIFFWLFFRYNLINGIYDYAGKIEREYFKQ